MVSRLISCITQVELAVNDASAKYGSPMRKSYERLLRNLMMLPERPAVIMLQTFRGYDESQLCVVS